MGHLSDGTLRRHLDEQSATSDDDRAHLAECGRCQSHLQQAARDRQLVVQALGGPGPGPGRVGIDGAWADLSARLTADQRVSATDQRPGVAPRPIRRRAARLRHPVAAGMTAVALLVGGTAVAAAADWLPIFKTQSVQPVAISLDDVSQLSSLRSIGDLSKYGDLQLPQSGGPSQVSDAAAAQARSGIALPRVGALPKGVHGEPTYYVADHQTATFTFSAAKAQQAQPGAALPPAGLDGAKLRIDAGPGVAVAWMQDMGNPALVVGRMKAPSASAEGASLLTVRDYLLSLPGFPAALAAQLKAVTGDGTTLPIPVLESQMSSSQTMIGGTTVTVLNSRSGVASAAIWVRNGELTVVGGLLTPDDVVKVARGLH